MPTATANEPSITRGERDGNTVNIVNDPIWILAETCSSWKRNSYLPEPSVFGGVTSYCVLVS